MKLTCVLCVVLGCASAAPGSARNLAETLKALQAAAFHDSATGDAIMAALKAQAPAFHKKASFASTLDYPFASQTASQAASPDVIHINFDVPSGHSSFVQTHAKDSDAIGSLMKNYAQIGEIVANYESHALPSDADIRNMVGRANSGAGANGGNCPGCSFESTPVSTADNKPVLEVRLAAPKVAPWHSLISGLVQQREQLETKYMTMFRELFEKKLNQKPAFLQKVGGDSVQVNVAPMKQVDPQLASLVVSAENEMNQQELAMLKTAMSSLEAASEAPRSAFVQTDRSADFDIKVGAGSRVFPRFYEAVRNMEALRHASESRIREHVLGMMARLYKRA